MLIHSLSFGNYNPSTIVNNPPYITNYPFYEYMRDNKMDFVHTDLSVSRPVLRKNEIHKDNFMTGLFVATAGAAGLGIYTGRNKLRACYRGLVAKFKR